MQGFGHPQGKAGRIGGYARRQQEWTQQSNVAAGEITQLAKQIRVAQLREHLAARELDNHRTQLQQAQDVEDFLAGESSTGRTTTTGYYALLRREVRGLYTRSYDLALQTARQAEQALRAELGDQKLSYVQPGYLVGTEGLMAGEKLRLDVRRMELAHLELDRREYELTQRVSLLQVAPMSLVQLRATGRCTFTVPEELFDLVAPGHYFRRLRMVGVSVPCVTGDTRGVVCTVRLLRSRIRTSPLVGAGYAETEEDGRFEVQAGSTDVIVTSSGVDDTGLFDAGPTDARLRPFELKGAAGEWSLELPTDPAPLDLRTVTDVVLTLRYTAREGGQALRGAASAHLRELIAAGAAAGSARLLSVRHEFPTAWSHFVAAPVGDGSEDHPRPGLLLTLRREHYPFFAGKGPSGLLAMDVVAAATVPSTTEIRIADRSVDAPPAPTGTLRLVRRPEMGGLLRGTLPGEGSSSWGALPPAVGELALYFEDNALHDVYLVLRWH